MNRKSGGRSFYLSGSLALLFAVAIVLAASARSARAQQPARFIVTGTILDADGKAAANVPVKLLLKTNGRHGPTQRPPGGRPSGDAVIGTPAPTNLDGAQIDRTDRIIKSDKTDSAGHYTFKDVLPGEYSVFAGEETEAARKDVSVKNANPAPVDVKLNRK